MYIYVDLSAGNFFWSSLLGKKSIDQCEDFFNDLSSQYLGT